MLYEKMLEIVKKLEFDNELIICEADNNKLSIIRPSKVSSRFKNYDVNKNFQIYLNDGNRKFRPNHLRVMIDLNLRVRSRPDLKKLLCECFDNIFYKNDPETEILKIKNENFEHYLNPLKITAYLSQLFIIEQDYNYNKESKFEPPTLFYQGWVREFIDNTKEIDDLCMSVCRFRPPRVKYTCQDNKKHNGYNKNAQLLWYLGD
ncbi:MAG: hypothetical protein ACOCRO_01580 [Halanaerobiales bacterium]